MSSRNLEEEAKTNDLRSKIREVHSSKDLTPIQKARRIRLLMSGSDISNISDDLPSSSSSPSSSSCSSPSSSAPSADLSKQPFDDLERPSCYPLPEQQRALTHHPDGTLGCEHYSRGCKMVAPCCGQIFTCRLCHDAQVADGHKIDRFAVRSLVCMHCWTLQPFSELCTNPDCGKSFGRYYCGVCHFIDNHPTKNLWHCFGCNLCRVGSPGETYRHCDVCAACMAASTFESHKCIPQTLKSDCPVCSEDMFASRNPSVPLRCGHWMHSRCLKDYCDHGHQRCPLCKKTIVDVDVAQREWQYIARMIQIQPMPPEFAETTVDIICNDCNQKAVVPYHFFGARCPQPACSSFNTDRLNVHNFPRYVPSEASSPQVLFDNAVLQLQEENEESGEDGESIDDDDDDEDDGEGDASTDDDHGVVVLNDEGESNGMIEQSHSTELISSLNDSNEPSSTSLLDQSDPSSTSQHNPDFSGLTDDE